MKTYNRTLWVMAGILASLAVPRAASAQFGPAWWAEQRRACGLPASLVYNTWVAQGSPCPAQESSARSSSSAEQSKIYADAIVEIFKALTATDPEAERKREAMEREMAERKAELIRQRAEEVRQRRLAEQRRVEAMFAQLGRDLKLHGLPNSLELKSTGGVAELTLKTSGKETQGYGIQGLPGLNVGGPAAGPALTLKVGDERAPTTTTTPPTPETKPAASTGGIPGLPGINLGGPGAAGIPGLPGINVGGPIDGVSAGIPGLPSIYLDGVKPDNAAETAALAGKLSGAEQAVVQDAALGAAQKNPLLTGPSQDPNVTRFQQSTAQYQAALQAQATTGQQSADAEARSRSDQDALDFVRAKVAQAGGQASAATQKALAEMAALAKTDEEASVKARESFEAANVTLSLSRANAAGALATLAPNATPSPAPTASAPPNDGGHPIDSPATLTPTQHGLVGGTTWTFGITTMRPGACNDKCQADVQRQLDGQLALYCASQTAPAQCVKDGLPFTSENYDFVVSMGSAHGLQDLAARVIWDNYTFGEFTRANKEMFASLEGRQFETLDCHSNGAMLCLAALRSGSTTAKEVRLFGPQMSPGAAERWREYAAATHTTIKVFINNGDPIPAASWGLPTSQELTSGADPLGVATAGIANSAFQTWLDGKWQVMDQSLSAYGFEVHRFYDACGETPDPKDPRAKLSYLERQLSCHSMTRYETNLKLQKSKK